VTRISLSLVFALAVSVCVWAYASFVSGNAAAYESRREVQRVVLKPGQLNALSQWLEHRQLKWGAHPTEPSTEPVLISLDLTRADGKTDYIEVIAAARGGRYMRLSIGPGTEWAYRSVGGILKTRYAQQPIGESEFTKLYELLFQPPTVR
jgi:hypothetical protein